MSSDSSNSDRSLPDLGVRSARGPSYGPRRRIQFDDNDIAANSPPKRAKGKWLTNLKLCRNIPRLDTTFRPRRLIDELPPSLLQAGLSKNVVIRTPRVKQIPRMPRMPGPHFSSMVKPRCSPSATHCSSSRTPSPSFSPPPFKSAEKRSCKKNSNPGSHSNSLDECSCPRNCAVCGLAMQMIYEKVIALEEDNKKKMVCPCLECGCCFYNKPCGTNAHISIPEGLQPSRPRSGMLPPRRPVNALSLHLSIEEVAEISELNDWMYTPESVPGRVAIPTNEVPGVRKEWFRDLFIGHHWLDEDHIDNIMILLGLQHRNVNEPWSHNWSYLDIRCWHGLTGNQFDAVIEFVGPFASGRAPRWIGRNWRELQTLYGVGNVLDCHWFLYSISIPDRIITVYDSNYSRASWVSIVEIMETYARNLGRLLTITEGFEWVFRPPQFQVVRCASAPQQVNNYDCGVMVVEYFRALANGEDIAAVDPTASQDLRQKYCAKLFKYGSSPFYGRILE